MRWVVFWIVPLLAFTLALAAADSPKEKPKEKPKTEKPAPAAEQFQALEKEREKTFRDAQKAFNEAKTQEDKQKIIADFQKSMRGLATKFLQLAEKNPKEDVAPEALARAINFGQGTPTQDKAVELALKILPESKSKKVGEFCQFLGMSNLAKAEKLLRAVAEKNPEKENQAQATLSLAQMLKQKAERFMSRPQQIGGCLLAGAKRSTPTSTSRSSSKPSENCLSSRI